MPVESAASFASRRRRSALRAFYVLVVAAVVAFSLAFGLGSSARKSLVAVGGFAGLAAVWSFVRFIRTADDLQRNINAQATIFAFIASVILSLIVGLLQRYGFLPGASLLLPALMIALWSIGLIIFSWRYQ